VTPRGSAHSRLEIRRLPGVFAVHRLPHDARVPAEVGSGTFVSITRTPDELSIVAPDSLEIPGTRKQSGWACFHVVGPLEFSCTGIIAALAGVLADAEIPVFVVSTFDTDWLLVPSEHATSAQGAWRDTGHDVG
jgi:hypothetical protein